MLALMPQCRGVEDEQVRRAAEWPSMLESDELQIFISAESLDQEITIRIGLKGDLESPRLAL
ncbi:MAG: hypothetical protein WCD50_06075 [Onishia taeanensis]|uniref:hypothetical protein n=1 Tax=Onishia taeanensis TaxID=284577 RepID=UPI003C7AB82F